MRIEHRTQRILLIWAQLYERSHAPGDSLNVATQEMHWNWINVWNILRECGRAHRLLRSVQYCMYCALSSGLCFTVLGTIWDRPLPQ